MWALRTGVLRTRDFCAFAPELFFARGMGDSFILPRVSTSSDDVVAEAARGILRSAKRVEIGLCFCLR